MTDTPPDFFGTARPPRRRSGRGGNVPGSPYITPAEPLAPQQTWREPARPDNDDAASETDDVSAQPRHWWHLAAAAAVAVIGFCVGVGAGAPVLGHGFDRTWAAAGGAVAVIGVAVAVWVWAGTPRRAQIIVTAVSAFLVVSFTWGAVTTVSLDGRPLFALSQEATAWNTAQTMLDDVDAMADAEELLLLDAAAARSAYPRLLDEAAVMSQIADRWAAAVDGDDVPEAFLPAAETVRNAAFWARDALQAKAQQVVTPQENLAADVTTKTATFLQTRADAVMFIDQGAAVPPLNVTPEQLRAGR